MGEEQRDPRAPIPRECSSGYRGVCWSKSSRNYVAQLKSNRKTYYLGTWTSETAAAMAYDQFVHARFQVPPPNLGAVSLSQSELALEVWAHLQTLSAFKAPLVEWTPRKHMRKTKRSAEPVEDATPKNPIDWGEIDDLLR